MKRRTVAPTKICIHHSLTADNGVLSDTAAIRRYHVETNGWDDIGYHYLVERVKIGVKVEIGRPIGFEGAHCPEINATSIGICLVGNYDLAPPDTEMLDALVKLVRELMVDYNIPVSGIHFHNEYSAKSCPGKLFPRAGFILSCSGEERPKN